MVDTIYNFGRGFATSLPLLLVKQVVTPPSGEETMCQCLEIRCTCSATPIITALILVMVMASVLVVVDVAHRFGCGSLCLNVSNYSFTCDFLLYGVGVPPWVRAAS